MSPNAAPPSSWTPLSLVALGDTPPLEPTIGGIAYPGSLSLHYGEPEAVKTWLNLILCLEQIRAGRHAFWVDFEMTPRTILGRLRDLGATDDELERFLYVQPSEPIGDPHVHAAVAHVIDTQNPSICVVDAMAGAFGLHGLDGNQGDDVERFYGATVGLLRSGGAAVNVIDHVTKDKDTRGRWPIGSQRKLGGADVGLSIEMVKPFGRGRAGLAKLRVTKDRHGALPRPLAAELALASDPDTGLIAWNLQPTHDEGSSSFRPTGYMDKILEFLSRQTEPVKRGEVSAAIPGKNEWIVRALDCLIEEQKVSQIDGPSRAKLVSLAANVPTFPSVP